MDVALRVRGLGKRYRIGQSQASYRTAGEALTKALRRPFRGFGGLQSAMAVGRSVRPSVWALRDLTFDVRRGEVVGIIGRNGAGKSTLLKILSRITEPSAGFADIAGRVGSLLEVGTGFHAELTGRENVYLNGAILGMQRSEIARRFDEIVDFAEVERFIDTPVKHYSSGMYLRLAFAVAAHLEPDILIIDEVLAVGDAAFQRKCLSKMEDVGRSGRTVLFVSHQMAAVQALCDRGILLEQGAVRADGPIGETVTIYLRTLEQRATQRVLERTERRGRGRVRLADIAISDALASDGAGGRVVTGRPTRICMDVIGVEARVGCAFTIYDQHGQPVATFDSSLAGPADERDAAPVYRFVCEISELPLVTGHYRINVAITSGGGATLEDHLEGAAVFDVEPGEIGGRPVARGNQYGSVHMKHRWIAVGSRKAPHARARS